MGCLRVFLALSVVISHVHDRWCLVNGGIAVISFFIISGFYMAMVIDTSYSRFGTGWVGKFYRSRALRLYPVYIFVLITSVLFYRLLGRGSVLTGDFVHTTDPVWWTAMLLANLGIFGLDVLTFLLDSVSTTLPDLRELGVSWTLGIELQYYLAAPFIVTRSWKFQIVILVLAIALRLSLLGAPTPGWRYYFAPADWCFFMLGAVGYRIGEWIGEARLQRFAWIALALLALAALWADLAVMTEFDRPRLWLYYVALAAAIPFLFALTRDLRWDRLFGNLSYPIYLVQFPAIAATVVAVGVARKDLASDPWLALAAIAGVAAAGLAVLLLIDWPVDRYRARQKRARLSTALAPEATA